MRESGGRCPTPAATFRPTRPWLRSEIRRLTEQITDIVTLERQRGLTGARVSNIEGVVSDATSKGQEAVHAVREVGDTMVDAIDESLKKRPYTTLRAAAGIGFLPMQLGVATEQPLASFQGRHRSRLT